MASSLIEAKVLAKVRSVLTGNATITGIVSTRVYDSHISMVGEPVYPAISLHILDGLSTFVGKDMVQFTLQIDLWFPVDEQVKSVMYDCYHAIRGLLHRYSVSDGTVRIIQMTETASGAVLFEPERRLWHMARRYSVIAL